MKWSEDQKYQRGTEECPAESSKTTKEEEKERERERERGVNSDKHRATPSVAF